MTNRPEPETYSMRGPARLGLAAMMAFVAGFGLWATQARLAGAIIAEGQVADEGGRQVVQHPVGGAVTEILARDGDKVAAGDILLRLDDSVLQSDLRIVEDRLSELVARAARLTAERDGATRLIFPAELAASAAASPEITSQIDGQTRLFAARRATLAESEAQLWQRIAQLRAQTEGILAQRAAVETQLALIGEEEVAKQFLLEKGLVQKTTVLALRREAARLTGQIGELTAAIARTEDQMTEVEMQVSALRTRRHEEAATELREIGPMILELGQTRHALLDRIAGLSLRAPAPGTVFGLAVTSPQAVLRPAEPALFIMPQDRPVVVMARIPPLEIESVSIGQLAELIPSALPSADRLRLRARVSLVSADVLTDQRTGAAHYLARLELEPDEADRLGDRALVSGMPVEVYFLTGERTPLSYLLQPFTAYFTRALRES